MSEKTTTIHDCTVDETAGGAETTGAVKRAAAEVRDEMPTCGLCSDDRCTPCMDDAERYARAALSAALDDEDTSRSPDEGLAPGSLARALWAAALTDGDNGLTRRDARVLAAAVRVHLVGGAA